jgi:glycosyltransferase involved in cell wall biosynthesis
MLRVSSAVDTLTRPRHNRAPAGLSAEVVVLTRDSVGALETSVDALRQAASAAEASLLVVDFGSNDGTREYVAERAPEARGVWLERGDQFGEALQVAAAASSADVVVMVDSSLRPTNRQAVARLLDHLARHAGAAAVAPLPEGIFAIRRADLAEVIRHPEHHLGSQADLARELLLQGRRIDALTGERWDDLLVGTPAQNRPGVAPRRAARPVVLHVAECFATGTERHLLDLIRHLESFEHVLAIPSHHQGKSTADAAARAEEAGARVERVEMGRSRAPQRHALSLLALRRLVRRLRPEVVHGHSSIGGAMARLATAGTPVPVVYTPHAASRASWAIAAERLLSVRTDRVIAVSESERDYLLAHRMAAKDQVAVIPNGIDLTPPPPLSEPLRSRLGIAADAPLFGCAGRLVWQKAPDVFVSACTIVSDQLPGAHFVLIGSGPLKAQIDAMIARAGIADRFHLIEILPNAAAAFRELDAYVLPSRFEGGPYTPLEAMRAGTPVVVTNAPGNRDVVKHWVSGLVVPQDEPHALASAMLTLVKIPELGDKLVDGARRSLGRFEVREMAAATAAVYEELCAKPV